jgi:hypothetical protein
MGPLVRSLVEAVFSPVLSSGADIYALLLSKKVFKTVGKSFPGENDKLVYITTGIRLS